MATKMMTLAPPTPLGAVADDPAVIAARATVDGAVAVRERTAAEASALRTLLAAPPSAGDGLSVLRARVGLPAAELAEAEARLAYEEAAVAWARVEAEARAQRGPASRARVAALVRQLYAVLDGEVMPRMLILRDLIERENIALGRQAFSPSELLWPEFLGPSPGDSLLEHRRRLLTHQGWFEG